MIGVVPCFKVKVIGVVVKGSIASLKVAAIFWLIASPVAALAGTVKLTIGAVVSGVAPVVKLQTMLLAGALPARSLVPVRRSSDLVVLAARSLNGLKVAVTPA